MGTADRIAYVNHDIDDAIRAGILREADLPGYALTACSAPTTPLASRRWCTDMVRDLGGNRGHRA